MQDSINKEGEFSLVNYSRNLNDQIKYINMKIKDYELKLTALKNKELIIDDMINRSNEQVQYYIQAKNMKVAGIHQGYILTQFETLGQVQEMLIKYEEMINKSVKMLIDLENHKINSFVKIAASKKQEKSTDDDYGKLMNAMQKLVTKDNKEHNNLENPMLETVREQLKLEGY